MSFKRLVLIFILISTSYCFSQVKKVPVTAYSVSYYKGINQGLVDAIGMVNGRSIESESVLNTSELSVSTNKEDSYYSSEDYQSQIREKTKGIVQGYEVVSSTKNADGLFEIKLLVSVAVFKKSKSANRKRIAVTDMNFRGDCCYFESTKYNGSAVSQELSNSISTYLVQTRKFTVLDRQYQDQLSSERKLLSSGNVPATELVKIGQELFADYMLVGTVNSLNIRKVSRKMMSSDTVLRSIQANASINYRIVDAATGQIKFAETFNARVDDGLRFSDTSDLIFEKSISNASKMIGVKILEAIYPMVIESINGNEITVGTGGDIVKVGDRYNLIQYGDKIRDSYTKESLGRKETVIGEVEIVNVTSKMSYGKIIKTSVENLESTFKPKSLILRSLSKSAQKNSTKKKVQEKRKKEKEKLEQIW